MAVVVSRPTPPGRLNPSAASIKRCHSRTVRLECPDELTGTWDGPVYATLGREPLSKRPSTDTPFLDSDDGAQRLAWEATLTILRHDQRLEDLPYLLRDYVDAVHFIPHWRLTEPHRDLKAELLERPLLSVFRFVRFTTYFVASPRCDTKFVRVTSDVHLCGQVIAYSAASRMSLVDDVDLLLEPSSGFVCQVAIRHYADELRRVVAIPLENVRVHHISQAEYMMGYYHQLPVTMVPSDFNAVWPAGALPHGQSASAAVRRLASDSVVPGMPPVSTVDSSPRSVAYITPRGEKTASTIEEYVQATKLPPRRTAPDDDADASDSPSPVLPLLRRDDSMLTPSDVFEVPTRSPPQVSAPPATGVAQLVPPAAGPGPAPVSTTSTSVRADNPVIQRLFEQQAQLLQEVTLLSASVLHRSSQAESGPPPQSFQGVALSSANPRPDRPDRTSPHLRSRSRRSRSRSRPVRQAHHSPTHGSPAPRQAHSPSPPGFSMPRQARQRSRSRSRPRGRRHRSRSRSPRRRHRSRSPPRRVRSRSPPRRSRSRSPHRRSRSRDRSPRTSRPIGNALFRPTERGAQVHAIARVGPRSGSPHPGNDDSFARFDAMCPHDKVCFMLQHERFRGRYRATKVAIKMLYAVDFASRPFDHFLSSDDPATYHQDRTVLHGDGQWGGPEPAPRFQIRRAAHLHSVLWAVQDAASEWYPSDVVAALRAVHTHAIYEVPGTAPLQEIHAMCNLYQAVFRQLFEDILHGTPSRDLEERARCMLSRDSPEYIRFVTRVLTDAVHRALLRQPGQGTANPRAQRQAPPHGRPSATRTPGIQRAQSSVIPAATRNQIPLEAGIQVCMQFQVEKDCTFPRCPHVHQLRTLPPDVLQWVATHHGGLKSGHPQHA